MPTITDANGIEIAYGTPSVAAYLLEEANRVMVFSDSTLQRESPKGMRPFWRNARIKATHMLTPSPGLGTFRTAGAASSLGGVQNYSPFLSSSEKTVIESAVADTTWSVNRLMQVIFRGGLKPTQVQHGTSNNCDCFAGSIIDMTQANGGRVTFEYLAHPLGEPQSIFFLEVLSATAGSSIISTSLATSASFSTYADANEVRQVTVNIASGWTGVALYAVVRQVGLSAGTAGRFLVGLRIGLEDVSTIATNLAFDVVSSSGESVAYYLNVNNLSAGAWTSINNLDYDAFVLALGINGFTNAGKATWKVDYQSLIDKIRALNPTLPIVFTSQLRLVSPQSDFYPTLKELVDDNANTVLINTADMVPAHAIVFQGWTAGWQTDSTYKFGDMVAVSGVYYVYVQASPALSIASPSSDLYDASANPTGKWLAVPGTPSGDTTATAQISSNAFYGDTIHPTNVNTKVYGQIIWDALSLTAQAVSLLQPTTNELVAAINASAGNAAILDELATIQTSTSYSGII